MRNQVPPLKAMLEIDAMNIETYRFPKPKAVALLPTFKSKGRTTADGTIIGGDDQGSLSLDGSVVVVAKPTSKVVHPSAHWASQKFSTKVKKVKTNAVSRDEEDKEEEEDDDEEDDDDDDDDEEEEEEYSDSEESDSSIGENDRDNDNTDNTDGEGKGSQVSEEEEDAYESPFQNSTKPKPKPKPNNENDVPGNALVVANENAIIAGANKAKVVVDTRGDKPLMKKEEIDHRKALKAVPDKQAAPKVKQKKTSGGGFVPWIYKKLAKKTNPHLKVVSETRPRQSLLTRLDRIKNRATATLLRKKLIKSPYEKEEFSMWASRQAYYSYMMLSRLSRMDLVLRSQQMRVSEGERVSYVAYTSSQADALKKYFNCKKYLYKECAKLVTPPFTLKDMNQRSFVEITVLFESQKKKCNVLWELERVMIKDISREDYFLPLISAVPVYSRDIALFDASILDGKRLGINLGYELTSMQVKERMDKLLARYPDMQKTNQSMASSVSSNKMVDSTSAVSTTNETGGESGTGDEKNENEFELTADQKLHKQEEKEEIFVGKMAPSISTCLDGTGSPLGARDMLLRHLALDECLIVWHLPQASHHKLQALLVWRDNSYCHHEHYTLGDSIEAREANKKYAQRTKGKTKKIKKRKGIVMEIAMCDLDAGGYNKLCQNYLDALHARPAPKQIMLVTDALRALSCALSINEFFHMVPESIRSFVMCCPPKMRIIPWHLLLIEVPNDGSMNFENEAGGDEDKYRQKRFVQKEVHSGIHSDKSKPDGSPAIFAKNSRGADLHRPVKEVHVLEKYCVRLGPTLYLFELCAVGSSKLKHKTGLHRMCAIDGETEGHRSQGVRGTDLEVASVTSTFSADPTDFDVLQNESSVPDVIKTGIGKGGDNADYKFFKKRIYMRKAKKPDYINRRTDQEPEEEEDDDPWAQDSDEDEEEKERVAQNQYALSMCRILHISAQQVSIDIYKDQHGSPTRLGSSNPASPASPKGPSSPTSPGSPGSPASTGTAKNMVSERHGESAIFLPPKKTFQRKGKDTDEDLYHAHNNTSSPGSPNKTKAAGDAKDRMTSSDIIRQVYVKNCALAVLSRFGMTDDIADTSKCDPNCHFLEAIHLAGANCVLYPTWGGSDNGIGALANLVFLVRFYATLPTKSKDRLSIIETVREVQLWMRHLTADDVIAFVQKSAIPEKARVIIIKEMESYVEASLNLSPQKQSNKTPKKEQFEQTEGNRVGGDRKFFNHFLHWGAFAVSGHGGNVHHDNLTEEHEAEQLFADSSIFTDKELDNIEFEAAVLRMEGKHDEALILERRIFQLRVQKVKLVYQQGKNVGYRATRGLMDTVEYLDKKFLDQDDDSIDEHRSDDENKPPEKDWDEEDAAEREEEHIREGEEEYETEDEEDDDDDEFSNINGSTGGTPLSKRRLRVRKKKRRRFVPQQMDINLRAEGIEFDALKGKVSDAVYVDYTVYAKCYML